MTINARTIKSCDNDVHFNSMETKLIIYKVIILIGLYLTILYCFERIYVGTSISKVDKFKKAFISSPCAFLRWAKLHNDGADRLKCGGGGAMAFLHDQIFIDS